jgi:hypothetical protein
MFGMCIRRVQAVDHNGAREQVRIHEPATPICREEGGPVRSHSPSFDHRRLPETLRTAMATAFFCPTSTTNRFPRVMPV